MKVVDCQNTESLMARDFNVSCIENIISFLVSDVFLFEIISQSIPSIKVPSIKSENADMIASSTFLLIAIIDLFSTRKLTIAKVRSVHTTASLLIHFMDSSVFVHTTDTFVSAAHCSGTALIQH